MNRRSCHCLTRLKWCFHFCGFWSPHFRFTVAVDQMIQVGRGVDVCAAWRGLSPSIWCVRGVRPHFLRRANRVDESLRFRLPRPSRSHWPHLPSEGGEQQLEVSHGRLTTRAQLRLWIHTRSRKECQAAVSPSPCQFEICCDCFYQLKKLDRSPTRPVPSTVSSYQG